MPQLTGSAQTISLGEAGYAIRAPGLLGDASMAHPRSAADRSRSRAPADGSAALDEALAATQLTEVRRVEVSLRPRPGPASFSALRGPSGGDEIELQVPDLGPETGQLVLACDESGVLTWHLPLDDQHAVQTPATRGSGGVKRFRIPAVPTPVAPSPEAAAPQRSLLGLLGRKLLKVLIYPVLDPVIGAVGEFFAARWEVHHRPYGLRTFTPDNRHLPWVGALQPPDWDRLAGGRALLYVHGTFSTAHSAFDGMSDDTFAALHERYGGRVFAIDHPTLSQDPRRNVQWLLQQVPVGCSLEIDIVCHSRGGLVARTLAERPASFGLDSAVHVGVRRVVMLAVPNQGTPLANPDHMVNMVDRFTTALNLFPSGPLAETLEAIITVVKVVGHGALQGLDGLVSMRPQGEFMRALNEGTASSASYFAVSADFEPTGEGLRALVAGKVADAALDRIFEETRNDLVVPEPGVYAANGNANFPIPVQRLLRIPSDAGVVHTTMFGYSPASSKLLEWLS